ncbi:MAG: aminopeptidase [Gammaproteobacteria bacterium]
MRLRLGVVLLLATLTGCESLGYYRQGIAGQIAFYGAREPIAKVLARDDLSADERRRLEQVPQILAFARDELAMPVKGQYRDYVRLEQPAVAWTVYAAPELSFVPYRWCYFFRALCMEYRGYFALADAQAHAAKLAARGYDTHIGGVAAFSSLGLLDDPMTSVLTAYHDDLMTSVLIHELAHAVLYVKDDTPFNESFATAVAGEGLRRWLARHGGADAAGGSAVVAAWQADQQALTAAALAIRAQLMDLYASPLDDGEKRARKRDILDAAAETYLAHCAGVPGATCRARDWFGAGLNNARLNAVATYESWVPAFAALIRAHDGDMGGFYDTVREMGTMPRPARDRLLRAMLAPEAVQETAP